MNDPSESNRMKSLSSRIREARGDVPRRDVASRAAEIAARIWSADAPLITVEHVRDLEVRMVNPPADGRIFRCVLAAVEIKLADALVELDYWPDAILAGSRSTAMAVAETMKMLGYPNAKLVSTVGRRITIEV